MFDSHCHLQFNAYKDDCEAVIRRCLDKGVSCNIVGTQKDTSKAAVELAEKYDGLYATIGLHPIHTTHTEVDEEEILFESREENWDDAYYSELAKSKKVIAVGECGIELFHLPPDANKNEILKKQTEVFLQQINFARQHNLPLVIHIRDAYDETIEVLRNCHSERSEESLKVRSRRDPSATPQDDSRVETPFRGTIHCFSGNWRQAQQFLDMGFYLGFTGVISFPPRKTNPQPTLDLLEVVKNCPLDRMLIETDAPYLAPQAYRGERCEPWMVSEVAKKIAEIKNISIENVLLQVNQNSEKLFGIKF
ncbi:MAG: TatD family hydrolase [Candidatus Magasanikbacteria bacterium]